MSLSNGTAGAQSIPFETALTIALASGLTVTDPTDLQGNATVLDCSPVGGSTYCLSLSVSGGVTPLRGVTFSAARNAALRATTGGGDWLADGRFVGHGNGLELASTVTDRTVTSSVFSGNGGDGIRATGGALSVRDGAFFDNAIRAVYLDTNANDAILVGNRIVRGDRGVLLGNGVSGAVVRHNTFVSTAGDAPTMGSAQATEVTHSRFALSGQRALVASDSNLAYRDSDAHFADAEGDCTACAPDAHAVSADPQLADPAADDYTLAPLSPLLDAGIDRGEDRNGAAGGVFNGLGHDICYWDYK